jgi:hypothetical protein
VAITAPANNATFTAPATVNLSAVASDTDGTISKVEFYRGAILIATVTTPTAGAYSFSDTNVAAGTYNYTAKAYDNNSAVKTSAAVNVTVTGNAAPSVTITAPANNTRFTPPATVNLSATATDTDGTISKVEFYRGTTLIATVTTPTAGAYRFTDTNVAAGTYGYTARAYDNNTPAAVTTSATVNVTVSATGPATVNYQYDELGRLIGITQ